jgi:hypothetical protein
MLEQEYQAMPSKWDSGSCGGWRFELETLSMQPLLWTILRSEKNQRCWNASSVSNAGRC